MKKFKEIIFFLSILFFLKNLNANIEIKFKIGDDIITNIES